MSSSYINENARKTAGYVDIENVDRKYKKVKLEDEENDSWLYYLGFILL